MLLAGGPSPIRREGFTLPYYERTSDSPDCSARQCIIYLLGLNGMEYLSAPPGCILLSALYVTDRHQ